MLRKRLLTILVALPIAILGILYLPDAWFAGVSAVIVALCAWEWASLIPIQRVFFRILYIFLVLLMMGLTFVVPIFYWLMVSVVLWLWALLAVIHFARGHNSACGMHYPTVKYFLGLFMLLPFWVALNVLRNTSMGPLLLIFVLVLVWAVDSGAYIAGRLWGAHLLIERVSPKKTWEGLVGGLTLSMLAALLYGVSIHLSAKAILHLLELSFVTVLFAVLGDLFESMLKRQAGIKDSGGSLPGHGGFLDRFDSVIAALPLFTLLLWGFPGIPTAQF